MTEQEIVKERRIPLSLGSAIALWFAAWFFTGLVWGPPLGPMWINPLPYWLYVVAQFLPLVITLTVSLALMALLALQAPSRNTLIVLGVVSFAALLGCGIFLPTQWRLLVQGPLLMLFGIALGFGLARSFQQREWIIPVLVILIFIDVYSVFLGPTKAMMESDRGAKAAEYVMVTLPSSNPDRPFGVQPFFGFPDALVMALLLGLAVRFSLPLRRTAIAAVLGLLIAIAFAGLTGVGTPALPYICGVFWISQVSRLQMDRKSATQLITFLVIISAVVAVLQFFR
ncbi:hypothetical protein KQI84_03775 [bacterium]|nr:hypothetical protein [bacterium]